MRLLTHLRWLLPAAAFLVFSGCLELTGQRVTLHHDEARDRLSFVLCYDGVHNNKVKDQADAEERLRAFVRNGDVMLFDWFGHIQRKNIRDAAGGAEPPALAAFAATALRNADVRVLGHYRDPDGRIGAAQVVVFERASEVLAAANRAIDEAILLASAEEDDASAPWAATTRKWRAMAQRGHAWISLEGHSLVYRAPMDAAEWARGKLGFFKDIAKEVAQDDVAPEDHFWFRFLASAPLSIEQSGGQVCLRLGDPDAVHPIRVQWRDGYRPNLEPTVQEVAPLALDTVLGRRVLGGGAADPALDALIAWGPPEEQVRAVVAAARTGEPQLAGAAHAWLRQFAVQWNGAHSVPRAPEGADGFRAWDGWYRALLAWPRL